MTAYKQVPLEPTAEMQAAGFRVLRDSDERSASKRMQAIYAAMLAAAPEPPAEDGWQPIETAPKDGTVILVTNANYFGEVQRCQIVSWSGVILDSSRPGFSNVGWHNQFSDVDEDEPAKNLFTHWQPLPAPPALSKAPVKEKDGL